VSEQINSKLINSDVTIYGHQTVTKLHLLHSHAKFWWWAFCSFWAIVGREKASSVTLNSLSY